MTNHDHPPGEDWLTAPPEDVILEFNEAVGGALGDCSHRQRCLIFFMYGMKEHGKIDNPTGDIMDYYMAAEQFAEVDDD